MVVDLGHLVAELGDDGLELGAVEARWIKTITRRLLVAAVLTVPVGGHLHDPGR